ncbi:uncharacterized protein LOC135078231 isoform X2 [Ostrinia nubilalis]|uniref:uncharacterized protein LOC135078231 isoform X2 n=1 Tax=Ostrinia nubilalis TaxID=29057 RepID=UPI0030825232
MMNRPEDQNWMDNLEGMCIPEGTLKLASSASEQNVYFTYVCLVNDLNPNNLSNHRPSYRYIDGDLEEVDQEDVPIRVERSKALHELVESHRNDYEIEEKKYTGAQSSTAHQTTTSFESDTSENEDTINFNTANPNVLKLTKMKWLTEEQEGSPDSSSPSISPNMSSTSTCSRESDDHLSHTSVGDKYLSTILRLDREHNMFGLSNIAIVGSRPSRKMKKEDDKPVFPQTAIVQVCCGTGCCRHRSKTDLPSSLKCGGCKSCCVDPFCPTCIGPCDPPCSDPSPCPPMIPCPPSKCFVDCTTCYGMKVTVHRKPKFDPVQVELTPRSSCVLHKPFAARSCHHLPRCIPPSSCFPYLMPCFWPARPSAPCSVPARCFHNPPCLAPRKKRPPGQNMPTTCPPGKCEDAAKGTKCPNQLCPGKSPQFKQGLESKFGK